MNLSHLKDFFLYVLFSTLLIYTDYIGLFVLGAEALFSFIYSYKQDWFKLDDWTLTSLPKDFEEKVQNIKLAKADLGEKGKATPVAPALIDESSTKAKLLNFINSRITVYEGEISDVQERQSEFQGNITVYYLITLKDVKFGPQLKKASDYKEDDVENVDFLRIRVSDTAYQKAGISVGDKISCNGRVNQDNYWGLMLKRVSKLQKL